MLIQVQWHSLETCSLLQAFQACKSMEQHYCVSRPYMFCLLYLMWLPNRWLVNSLVQVFFSNLEIISRTKTP